MRAIATIALLVAGLASPAAAQRAGPGPAPGPWQQAYPDLFYNYGGIRLPFTVPGGSKGPGTINAAGLYLNGVLITSVPVTAANMPAFSGDCSSAAGTTALTCTKTQGTPFAPSATTDATNAGNIGSGTLLAARLPVFTGDVTSAGGTAALALPTVNPAPGSYGGASSVPVFTVNGKGLITTASAAAVVAPAGTLSGSTLAGNVVNTSITSVGTITTGVWNGTAIGPAYVVTGTSGAAIGLLNANKTDSGANTWTGTNAFSASPTVPTAAAGDSSTKAASTSYVTSAVTAAATAIPRGYLSGFVLSNNTTNPNTQVDVMAGIAASDDASTVMTTGATVTKSLAAWTVGTGNGCLDAGSAAANTWYHVFVVYNPTTPATDVLCSTSVSAPTLPTGYTKKRRVGSILTTGTAGNVTAFVQFGDEFQWVTPITSVNAQSIAGSVLTPTVAVPPGVRVRARMRGQFASANANAALLIFSPDEATTSINSGGSNTVQVYTTGTGTPFVSDVLTNTSQQIKALASVTNSTYSVLSVGWSDTRGRFQ